MEVWKYGSMGIWEYENAGVWKVEWWGSGAGASPLHCFALFNHDQVTPFMVIIAAFGRYTNSDQQGSRYRSAESHLLRANHSRLAERSSEHNSKTQIAVGASRSCGALARARTLGVFISYAREPERSE